METPMTLYVREIITGKTYTVHVDSSDTFRQIKEQVYRKSGIPIENQKLITAGKEAPDQDIVGTYDRNSMNPIFLIIEEMPGGIQLTQPTQLTRLQLYPYKSIVEQIQSGLISNYRFPRTYDYLTHHPNTIGVFTGMNGNTYYVELIYDPISNGIHPPQ